MNTCFCAQTGFHKPEIDADAEDDDNASEADAAVADVISKADADDGDTEDKVAHFLSGQSLIDSGVSYLQT